jgi:hypothetical protein
VEIRLSLTKCAFVCHAPLKIIVVFDDGDISA